MMELRGPDVEVPQAPPMSEPFPELDPSVIEDLPDDTYQDDDEDEIPWRGCR